MLEQWNQTLGCRQLLAGCAALGRTAPAARLLASRACCFGRLASSYCLLQEVYFLKIDEEAYSPAAGEPGFWVGGTLRPYAPACPVSPNTSDFLDKHLYHMQKKLQELGLESTPEEFVESLPVPVRRRVEALQELQGKHKELEAAFRRERAELEAKYEKLYGRRAGSRFGASRPGQPGRRTGTADHLGQPITAGYCC